MQRISFIHVTFDFMVTELHFFFWTIECEAIFFLEGGGGFVLDWLFQGFLRV